MKHDAQQKGTELKNQAELKGTSKCHAFYNEYLKFRVPGAEVKDKAGAAVDAAKDTADRKVDEIKPKVNGAVNDAKETGMSFGLRRKNFSHVCPCLHNQINHFYKYIFHMFLVCSNRDTFYESSRIESKKQMNLTSVFF